MATFVWPRGRKGMFMVPGRKARIEGGHTIPGHEQYLVRFKPSGDGQTGTFKTENRWEIDSLKRSPLWTQGRIHIRGSELRVPSAPASNLPCADALTRALSRPALTADQTEFGGIGAW